MVEWSFGAGVGRQDVRRSSTVEERAVAEARAGDVFCAQKAFPAAKARYAEAVRLQPGEARYRWLLAMAEWSGGEDDLTGQHLQELVVSHPGFAFGHSSLAEWYLYHGIVESAVEASAKAVALDSENLAVLSVRANALVAAGRLDEGLVIVERLIKCRPLIAPAVVLYAQLAGRHGKVAEALELVRKRLAAGGLAEDEEAALRFSAAALLEKLGQYDQAFAEAARANQLDARPFDPEAHERQVSARIAYFTKERVRSLPKAANYSDRPVLVVGMPRSGTSLVEQILASHPAVYGAGELDFLYWTMTGMLRMLRATEDEYPGCLDRMTADHATGMGQIYIEPLVALSPSSSRIIDKMPLNFLNLGLASVVLPGARIIHCRRDPMDTCVSCYMTSFASSKQFKCDLNHLGRFYRQYERLMAHWKDVLDLPILDVAYEEMVADPEGQSRRMVEFLGLPWDERCLKFHETQRPVATASSFQVRQPIYRTSLQRWRHYEKHLGPLIAALGER